MTPLELALVGGSALLHAVWSVAIKGSGDPLCFNALQKVGPLLLLVAVLPLVELAEVPGRVWTLLALTGATHALYFYWLSRAYESGDLSLVYPIARSTPALLPLVAVPVLGETISPGGAAGIAVVVAGVWAVHGVRRWHLSELVEPAVRFAYLTLLATVGYSLFDKAAMAELAAVPWSSRLPRAFVFVLLIYAASSVGFVPLVLWSRGAGAVIEAGRRQLPLATAASTISLIGYGLVLKALETAPASYVVTVRQTSVLFAVLLGVVVLKERPDRLRVLGAIATVAGVALIARFS